MPGGVGGAGRGLALLSGGGQYHHCCHSNLTRSLADHLGVSRAAEIFSRAALGIGHREATGVRFWANYERLTIEAEPRAPFQADGEMLGHAHHAVLTPAEGAIRVLRPGA